MSMRETLIIGTDEAGYGPNLGPLLVGASCWKIVVDADEIAATTRSASPSPSLFDFTPTSRDDSTDPDPFDAAFDNFPTDAELRLNASVAPISGNKKSIFPLLDSKKLFGATRSLATLERPFLLAAALLGRRPSTLAEILDALGAESTEEATAAAPWEAHDALQLNIPSDPKTLQRPLDDDLAAVREHLATKQIELLALRARRVQPLEFNRLLKKASLKSELLAECTTSLVVETLDAAQERDTSSETPACLVLCDKLGGRNRYAPLLAERFPSAAIRILREGANASVYRLLVSEGVDRAGKRLKFRRPCALEVRFTAKGESNAPTALASIVAKYLRELSMELFNRFWVDASRRSGREVAPTAGYPLDASRFRDEVANLPERAQIADDVFWRRK